MYVAAVSSKNKAKNRSQKLLPRKCVDIFTTVTDLVLSLCVQLILQE